MDEKLHFLPRKKVNDGEIKKHFVGTFVKQEIIKKHQKIMRRFGKR